MYFRSTSGLWTKARASNSMPSIIAIFVKSFWVSSTFHWNINCILISMFSNTHDANIQDNDHIPPRKRRQKERFFSLNNSPKHVWWMHKLTCSFLPAACLVLSLINVSKFFKGQTWLSFLKEKRFFLFFLRFFLRRRSSSLFHQQLI